jgi:hypothetical protein
MLNSRKQFVFICVALIALLGAVPFGLTPPKITVKKLNNNSLEVRLEASISIVKSKAILALYRSCNNDKAKLIAQFSKIKRKQKFNDKFICDGRAVYSAITIKNKKRSKFSKKVEFIREMKPVPTPISTSTPIPALTKTPIPTLTSTPNPTSTPVPTLTKTPVPTSTKTPTITPTPTSTAVFSPTLNPKYFEKNGDVNAAGKTLFEIPSSFSANVAIGKDQYCYYSCHSEKLGISYQRLYNAVTFGVQSEGGNMPNYGWSGQQVANVTAYLNRFR